MHIEDEIGDGAMVKGDASIDGSPACRLLCVGLPPRALLILLGAGRTIVYLLSRNGGRKFALAHIS